jgi:hypothetical protein
MSGLISRSCDREQMEGIVDEWLGVGIAVFAIGGGLGVAYYSVWLQSKAREMVHRERMAMIEKGLAPAALTGAEPARRRRTYQRASGINMICIGLGLAIMMGLMVGWGMIWVGAIIALFGVANLVNALLDDRDRRVPSNLEN